MTDSAGRASGPADHAAAAPEREVDRPNVQSGTLTAGSFDDITRMDDFVTFVSEAVYVDAAEILPRLAAGNPVVIQVVDESNHPVGGAVLEVSASLGAGEEKTTLMTATDGRAMFLPGGDAAGQSFEVTVRPPESEASTYELHAGQSPWVIKLADLQGELPQRLDLALVIDTTGSMSDELEYLKIEIDSIAQSINRMFPNVDQRFALVVYRDEGDEYVERTLDFTESLEDFRGALSRQSSDGGGDTPEAMHVALESAGGLSWREGNTARVLFLVADAPPHDDQSTTTFQRVRELREQGVRIYPVAGSGVDVKAEFIMRSAAFYTMGQYLFLTDHSGVGNPHAAPHVPEYQVERLDRLMIRMVAAELAGKRLVPDEIIAIEQGEGIVEPPIVEFAADQ